MSNWLTTLPLRFSSSAVQKCDGFHSPTCKKGGLVKFHHNEIGDCIGDMACQVWPQTSDPGLRLHLGFRSGGVVRCDITLP